MPSTENRVESVKEVFEVAQSGSQHKAMLFKALDRLAEKSKATPTPGQFVQDFIEHMKYCMIVFKKEPAVERMMDFVAEYVTRKTAVQKEQQDVSKLSDDSDDDEDQDTTTNTFLSEILTFLLKVHNSREKAVRYRTCQLISKIFENMDEEATIHEGIADKILTTMLERLCDKVPLVRCQAVCALARLQDPLDPQCPVISAYIYLMTLESSADVRKTVLYNIAITKLTLPHVIARTRDVKDSVRKFAFYVLSEKVSIRALSIAQRIQLLQDGLNDHVSSVKKMCLSKLVASWLKSCQNNVIDFLAMLDVQNSLETVETVLKELLKDVESEDLLQHVTALKDSIEPGYTGHIPLEKLDCEKVLYWRSLAEYSSKLGSKGQDAMDALLPVVSEFCEYIQRFIDDNCTSVDTEVDFEHIFTLEQLLTIAGLMDLSDEVGRKNLAKLIRELMINAQVPISLMPVLHERYMNIEPDADTRINQLAEVIADIREPITVIETPQVKEANRAKEVKMAGIRVKLNQLRDELETCVSVQEYEKAAEIKSKIVETEQERNDLEKEELGSVCSNHTRIEKDDPVTLVKCLSVAAELLQGITKTSLNPTLVTLVETLILPGVQNEDPLVRHVAVKCLGLCSLLSRDFARRHMVLFLQIVLLDVEQVQITSLKAILDLLQTFGLEAFKVTAAEQAIVNAEESLLDDPEKDAEDSEDDEDKDPSFGDELGEDGDQDGGENGDKLVEDAQKSVSSVFSVLVKLLDRENCEIRNIAAEGLAKLLLSGRVHSPKLLSRLLLLWYNPTTEEDVHLRHCLGAFLPAFAFECRANQELFEETFLPTVRTLFSAPTSSPLARVDVSNVADLLVQLTFDRHAKEPQTEQNVEDADVGADSLHGSLALKISNEILSDPEAPGVRVLCKTLNHLSLQTANKSNLKDLLVLATSMIQKVEDNTSRKYVDKFQQALTSLVGPDDENEEDECVETTAETPAAVCSPQTTSAVQDEADEQEDDEKTT